jgi:hypothetical protein
VKRERRPNAEGRRLETGTGDSTSPVSVSQAADIPRQTSQLTFPCSHCGAMDILERELTGSDGGIGCGHDGCPWRWAA